MIESERKQVEKWISRGLTVKLIISTSNKINRDWVTKALELLMFNLKPEQKLLATTFL